MLHTEGSRRVGWGRQKHTSQQASYPTFSTQKTKVPSGVHLGEGVFTLRQHIRTYMYRPTYRHTSPLLRRSHLPWNLSVNPFVNCLDHFASTPTCCMKPQLCPLVKKLLTVIGSMARGLMKSKKDINCSTVCLCRKSNVIMIKCTC